MWVKYGMRVLDVIVCILLAVHNIFRTTFARSKNK